MQEPSDRINEFIYMLQKEIKDDKKVDSIKNLFLEEYRYLRINFENKLNKIFEENKSLKLRVKKLEEKIEKLKYKGKESIHVKSKIEELLPLITKLNKISDIAKEMMSKIFIILVEEQLQTIIKLADSHAQEKSFSQIEEENLYYSLENLIHSDKLLEKAIKIAYKSEHQEK
ncbi:MAG: hypothetical protein EAX96_00675 [Candidatus Lokiarchaeota archaeon]|nr:hypothetical protein [Candidatus Lokiarchaeota archaeon]